MHLVFGLITTVVGIYGILFLLNNLMTGRLSQAKRLYVIEKLRSNRTGIENKTFKTGQMIECLKNPHTWMLSVITVSSNVTNGAVSSF